ncbi:hypothetical protein C8J57DRAFT_1629008 [Mycena rebaudengoi]|nr:hypothetical protein C8J57DRAFT_1629008 [Mycena rebaudengoi]
MPAVDVLPALSPEDPLFGLIHYVVGGRFIGACLVLLFEGILISQISHYYTCYPKDSGRLKLMVAVLFLLTILKTTRAFAITWINSIMYTLDPAGIVALNRTWYQVLDLPMGAVIATYVQSYYCYRLWGLSQKWWVVAPLLLLSVLSVISAIITAFVIEKTGASTYWFVIHVSSTFATDTLITLASTYFLLIAREKALALTRKLIRDLIKICFQTALPATTATLIELVCSHGGKSLKPRATNSVITILLAAVPIIYANCLLYVLNTRRVLRGDESSDEPGIRVVRLSFLGGAEVLTQIGSSDIDYHYAAS